MPRYAITTNFNTQETKLIEELSKKLGITKYKLLRDATVAYCKTMLKEEKKLDERGKESERQDSGTDRQTRHSFEDID
jgi:hypothetical protein